MPVSRIIVIMFTYLVYVRVPPIVTGVGVKQRFAAPIPPVLTQVRDALHTSLKYMPRP